METNSKNLMKRNKNNYSCAARTLLLVAVVAMMASCNKQEITPIEDEKAHKVVVTAKRGGMVSTTDTRTSIAENLDFTWVAGDRIQLFTEEIDSKSFTTNKGGSSNADFTGSLYLDGYSHVTIYAGYGDDSRLDVSNNVKYCILPLKTSQTQKHTSGVTFNPESIGDYALMFGQSENQVIFDSDITSTTNVKISMKPLTALLDFKITGITPRTVVRKLQLNASEAIFPSEISIAYAYGNSGTTYKEMKDNMEVTLYNKNNTIGVIVGDDGKLTIRLAILKTVVPGDGKLTISLITSTNGKWEHKSVVKNPGSGKTYEAGKAYDAGFAYNELKGNTAEGETTKNESATYPSVKVGNSSIYVYDRNAGVSVPLNTDYSAGKAKNWINGSSPSATNVLVFKGDYYTWEEAMFGFNANGTAMCPKGWRLPTYDEIKAIVGKKSNGKYYITHSDDVVTLTGDNGIICFFPLSGSAISSTTVGIYWSSTPNDYNAYSLAVNKNGRFVNNSFQGNGISVRCVKAVAK